MELSLPWTMPEWLADFFVSLAHKSWGSKKRMAFYRRLAVHVENGKPPREAILRLRKQVDLRSKGPLSSFDPDRIALTELSDRLANGETLAKSLQDWAPATELSIIQAGESSGTLPAALRSAIAGQGLTSRIIMRLFSESMDPLIMGGLGFYLVYIVGSRLIKPMEVVVNPDRWPTLSKLLLPMAAIANSPWTVVALILVIVCITVSVMSLSWWSGRSRVWVERLPPWNIYRTIQGAQWMFGFSRLTASGVSQTEALAIQAQYAKPWLKTRLLDAQQRMKNGRELGVALIEGGFEFPDRILADDISAFSGAADFSRLLEDLGQEWLNESEQKIFGVIRVLGVVANVGVNLMILLVVFGVYDLQNVMTSAAH